jgi:hypothetical protein
MRRRGDQPGLGRDERVTGLVIVEGQVAVARSILVIIWHLLADPGARYSDLGAGYYQARTDTNRKIRNHARQIQALGYDVTITKAA